MVTNYEKFSHYKVRCKCGEQIDFDSSNTEVKCNACNANITIKYLGHNVSEREIVEKTIWEFLKKIFSFRFGSVREWTKKEQDRRFEKFKIFSKDIYNNNLTAKAKEFSDNKHVRLATFYANDYLGESDPYDITTESGFTNYLFKCITFQDNNFVFSPTGINCPAVFEINIGSEKYYILHYDCSFMPFQKDNFTVTALAPANISFEFCLRVEVNYTNVNEVQWQLIDGQLVPFKTDKENSKSFFITNKRMAKINGILGVEFGKKLMPLIKSRQKYYNFNSNSSKTNKETIYCACTKGEIISEMQNQGILEHKTKLFEILTQGSNCFVVTACLGEENHPYVILLKEYRDQILYKTLVGKYLIDFYEIVGPHAAGIIRNRPILRKLLTNILIKPVVFFAVRCLYHKNEKI